MICYSDTFPQVILQAIGYDMGPSLAEVFLCVVLCCCFNKAVTAPLPFVLISMSCSALLRSARRGSAAVSSHLGSDKAFSLLHIYVTDRKVAAI